MKADVTAQEAVYAIGLPEWYVENTPAKFWTLSAFNLFAAALEANIIAFDSVGFWWIPGENVSKAGLAFFCKKASKFLRLSRGAHTSWKPFEIMFNPDSATPLKVYLQSLEGNLSQSPIIDRIEAFFNGYKQ